MGWLSDYQYRVPIDVNAENILHNIETTDLTTGITVTADTYSSSNVPGNTVDDNASTFWCSATSGSTPRWLMFDLGAGVSKIVSQYKITFRATDDPLSIPKSWLFQGSNTGAFSGEEVTLDQQDEYVSSGNGPFTFNCKSPGTTAFRYYRLYITKTSGNVYCQIKEVELFEGSESTLTDFPMLVHLHPNLILDTDLTTNKVITADTVNGAEYAKYATDNSLTTFWTSATSGSLPRWLKIDLTEKDKKVVGSYKLMARTSDASGVPNAFQLEGSNTGLFTGEETVVDSRSSITWGTNPQTFECSSPGTTAFRYYRLKITGTGGSTYCQIMDFQLFELALSNFDFSKVEDDLDDIRFTSSDGETLLKYELADAYYSGSTPTEAFIYVKIPSISSYTNASIYMYHGNISATNGEDKTNVWDSYNKLVMHLPEEGDGTTDEFKDSTSNNNDGTAVSTVTRVEGQIGYCQDFATSYITIDDSASLEAGSGDFTWSCKFNLDVVAQNHIILSRYVDGTDYFYLKLESGRLVFKDVYSSVAVVEFSKVLTLLASTWYDLEIVRTGSTFNIYLNDVLQYTTTDSSALTDRSVPLLFGAMPDSSFYTNGKLDELRLSNGIARTDAWRNARYNNSINSNILDIGESEEGTPEASITETIELSDAWSITTNQESVTIDEEVNLDDDWYIVTNPIVQPFDEEVSLSDAWDVITSQLSQAIDEEVTVDDDWEVGILLNINYPSKIISYNPLVYITNTDPAYIIQVDITDPADPVQSMHEIVGCSYAIDFLLNDSSDYFYINCADGKVVKIEKADLDNQTVIDTVETDDLALIDSIDSSFQTFVTTDNSTGELIMIDERTIESINTDFRFAGQITKTIDVWLNTILGKTINTDLRFLSTVETIVNTDLRWLKYSYTSVSQYPINQTTDWQIKINDVDITVLDDVNMKSIKIIHAVDNDSIASFILHRQHDKLNYTNTGVASEITNNNTVKIYIKGNLEFSGKISNINVSGEQENVNITAIANQPTTRKNNILIPLSSVNENIHLYHCLSDNIQIDNPPLLTTGAVITNSENKYWNGSSWVGRIKQAQVFSTHALAQSYIDGKRAWRKYLSSEIYPINADPNVQYYKGVQVNLGISISQNVSRWQSFMDTSAMAEEAENGTLETEQNWNYFWNATFENFITKEKQGSSVYIGTSLGSMSSDTFKMTGLSWKKQRQYDDSEVDLGWYYIGEAPYSIISTKNGRKYSDDRWEDRDDGLYEARDDSYNYVDFAKRVAELELDKLKNINGDIIPITSGTVDISLDGYYFYGVKLLSRINIDNTITSGIYKNNNGFPLGVKSVTIDSASMRVNCQCDNQLSTEEIDAIDDLYPIEDDYFYPGKGTFDNPEVLIHKKFDVTKWGYIL